MADVDIEVMDCGPPITAEADPKTGALPSDEAVVVLKGESQTEVAKKADVEEQEEDGIELAVSDRNGSQPTLENKIKSRSKKCMAGTGKMTEERNGVGGGVSEELETLASPEPAADKKSADACVTVGESSKSIEAATPGTPVMLPKKSNLKRPRQSETPTSNCSISSTPSKRIRIVENLEVANSTNHVELNGGSEGVPDQHQHVLDDAITASVTEEVEVCEEKVVWLNSGSSSIDQSIVNVDFVRDHLSPAKRKFSVEIEMRFILSETVSAVLNSKSSIAAVGPSEFHIWVARNALHNNPKLNAVYKENFMKLANIDAIIGFDLTSPKELTNNTQNATDGLYYVGELWHDSKGFREYVLSKTSRNVQQFSTKIFTWKITCPGTPLNGISGKTGILFRAETIALDRDDFPYYPVETVEPFGGSNPASLLDIDAIDEFVNFIKSRTNGAMLHTLIVDNPEISYVYESCREIRYQKQFYCQCLVALRSIRKGGTFVCKIFDTFTLFTNGLIFLLHKCFKSITMHKPSASSPYTSERFLICKG